MTFTQSETETLVNTQSNQHKMARNPQLPKKFTGHKFCQSVDLLFMTQLKQHTREVYCLYDVKMLGSSVFNINIHIYKS